MNDRLLAHPTTSAARDDRSHSHRGATARHPLWLGPALSAVLLLVGISCTADRPNLSGDGDIDIQCSPYADLLVTFTPPGETGNFPEGEAALGEPDGQDVAITDDAALTVSFVGLGGVVNQDGDDLRIIGDSGPDTRVTVFAQGGEDEEFEFVADLEPEEGATEHLVDIANGSVSLARSIRFVGQSGTLSIDAIESLASSCE